MKSLLALSVIFASTAAFAHVTSAQQDTAALRAFAKSSVVQSALKGLTKNGKAQVSRLSIDVDACDAIAQYLVLQPAHDDDSSGWESIAAIVTTDENDCSSTIVVKSVELATIAPKAK